MLEMEGVVRGGGCVVCDGWRGGGVDEKVGLEVKWVDELRSRGAVKGKEVEMAGEPLSEAEASRKARKAVLEGRVIYTRHALVEMGKDGLRESDIERALRGGVSPAEWENGDWRYRFSAMRVWAVVSFREEEVVVVVTAWRARQ